jgi:iron-sulfur cluster assembly protein
MQSQSVLVDVTPEAIAKLKESITNQSGFGIRLSVLGGGCAGLQYDIQPAKEAHPGDFIQDCGEIVLFIHPVAAAYLKGTRIDYSNALMDGGFKFSNPNASSTCGCGSSFGV